MNSVSIVLPTYNEAENIIPLIEEIKKNVTSSWDYEIIIVDDNSPDGTFSLVNQRYQAEKNIKCVLRKANPGLAISIYDGILSSKNRKILVMDTDFTHDPREIPNLLHVSLIYDVVSGSRFAPGGNMSSKRHYILSFLFNIFIRIILKTQVQDNLGGFFIMDSAKLRNLPLEKIFFGYGDYYFRLLQYAQRSGFSIVETPAQYMKRDRGESKSNFPKLFFSYLKSVMAFKFSVGKTK